jgi:hypothetical protein
MLFQARFLLRQLRIMHILYGVLLRLVDYRAELLEGGSDLELDARDLLLDILCTRFLYKRRRSAGPPAPAPRVLPCDNVGE